MPKVPSPSERRYLNEMQSALEGQMGIQGQLISAEKQYTPEWQAVQKQALQGGVDTMAGLYAGNADQSNALQQQFLTSQSGLYNQVGASARNAYQQTLDPTTAGLYSTMATQAAQGLANGGNLSPQEMQLAQQSARAAMASRGLQFSNQAIAAETLSAYNLSQQRLNQNRQYAGQVYGIGQQNASQAMSMYGQPLMSQMAQFSTPQLINQSGNLYGSIGAKLFQPESQYNAQLISANQHNQLQAAMANAQAKSGIIGGLMKGVGAVLGGPVGAGLAGKIFGGGNGGDGGGIDTGNTGYSNPSDATSGWTYQGDGQSN